MLYFYRPITHPITNMHVYMHYFFTQLFAEVSPIYDHTAYIHVDFKAIIDKYTVQLDTKLLAVFNAYMSLVSPNDKTTVQNAYSNNNNIEGICNNIVRPYKFSELPPPIVPPVRELYDSTGVLYKMLTSKAGYPSIKNRCGSLKGHFERFREANKHSICPFCGMENLLTDYDDSKNEYDHYISKGDYPFCSINFTNLVPVCDYCNKAGNKGSKDIPFSPNSNPQVQEKLYFPYSSAYPDHEISLIINAANTDLSDIDSWTLVINCTPVQNANRKERWVEIYNIENRYKSKIAKDSYKWMDRIVTKHRLRCKKKGVSFNDFREDILDDFTEYKDYNNAIMMKCFDEFIVNDPNCESYLTGHVII
jgi:hypothetical protein